MRLFTGALFILLSMAMLAAAQTVGQQQENIDAVLRGWEKAMVELQSFACEIQRTTTDPNFKTVDEFQGYGMFMRPQVKNDTPRARLELVKVKNKEIFERMIVTGPFLYQYAPATKTIYIHDMPDPKKGGADQESFLAFLFGMGADQAKTRYDMKLVYRTDGKPDPNYHYIQVVPRTDKDKKDFASAQLTLLRSNNLPRRIWYLQTNKTEIQWDFTNIQTNVKIPVEKYFVPVDMPGWRSERVKAGPEVGPGPRPGSK